MLPFPPFTKTLAGVCPGPWPMRTFPAFAVVALVATLGPHAARADEVDAYVARQMAITSVPGASVAVVRHGEIVKAAGYGVANLETETRATPETVYEIGSLAKQFTAAAILLLRQDGRLDLSDPLRRVLPEVPAHWGHLTIRHLLTHTAGIRNHVEIPGYLDRCRTNLSYETTPAREEALRLFFELPAL